MKKPIGFTNDMFGVYEATKNTFLSFLNDVFPCQEVAQNYFFY